MNIAIEEAIEALRKGDTLKADAAWEAVIKNEQVAVQRSANANHERGKIAENNYEFRKAFEFYQKAINLDEANEKYKQSYNNLKDKLEGK